MSFENKLGQGTTESKQSSYMNAELLMVGKNSKVKSTQGLERPFLQQARYCATVDEDSG
jgi:hypothetical protein